MLLRPTLLDNFSYISKFSYITNALLAEEICHTCVVAQHQTAISFEISKLTLMVILKQNLLLFGNFN